MARGENQWPIEVQFSATTLPIIPHPRRSFSSESTRKRQPFLFASPSIITLSLSLGLLQIDQAKGFSDLGSLRPELIGCLIIVFITLYFSLFKGVKSSGKVHIWKLQNCQTFICSFSYPDIGRLGDCNCALLYSHHSSCPRTFSSRSTSVD